MSGKPKKLKPEAVRRIRRWYQQWSSIPTVEEMAKREGIAIGTLMSTAKGLIHKTVQ